MTWFQARRYLGRYPELERLMDWQEKIQFMLHRIIGLTMVQNSHLHMKIMLTTQVRNHISVLTMVMSVNALVESISDSSSDLITVTRSLPSMI
jgi:hypothetical protein